MGYYKKVIAYGDLLIEQYLYPAPGGDEALLERLIFTNLSSSEKSIRYFDYWDVAWWLVRASGEELAHWIAESGSTVERVLDLTTGELVVLNR